MTASDPNNLQVSFAFDKPRRDERTNPIAQTRRPSAWRIWAAQSSPHKEVELAIGESVVIGTSPNAGLRVNDSTVSRTHCRVEATPAGLRVEDLKSTNGVLVAGVRVPSALVTHSGPAFVVGRTPIYARPVGAKTGEESLPGLVGESERLRCLVREVRCYAPHDVSVLIQGETGSGKDVVARALHQLSQRKGPFVAVNIGALQDSLADAELFGHKKGAFTGAVSDHKGAFEQAHGGTLFLDEIADISPAVQVKLLRAIEEKRIRPLGAEREVPVDVRVIAASWAQLDVWAAEGRFRWDLYHRLSTAVVRVPALRERRSDIALLARHFLRVDAAANQPCELTDDAVAALREHEWKGNVRELRAVLRRASMLCANGTITASELDLQQAGPSGVKKAHREPLTAAAAVALLKDHAGNVSAAARAAGLPRSTFRNVLASQRHSEVTRDVAATLVRTG